MIPLHLRISGFLSYRDAVEIDFNAFDLACISGHNGAGKSSLLDAITWSLFGEARTNDKESIINLQSNAAEVIFTFAYEQNVYRVQRSLQRGKSTVLEFRVQSSGDWRALTEKTTRETEKRIEGTLRLDYDTFVNASFFLQGKADEFTQRKASERKNILSNILGLEVWEGYKNKTAERRKELEREVDEIEGRVAEIDAELAEEDARKQRLAELESNLKQLTNARAAQESVLENIRKSAALLDKQRDLVETLRASLERARSHLSGLESRLAAQEADRVSYADLVDRAKEIESAYKAWQKARKDLEALDKVASEFREYEDQRQPLLREIESEKARLEQELSGLREQEKAISEQLSVKEELNEKIEAAQKSLNEAEEKLREREEVAKQIQSARERQAEIKAENDALKADMNQIKERIDSLSAAEGAECPLCGQELTEKHRKATLKQLESEGKQKGDAYRANQEESKSLSKQISNYELQIANLEHADSERLTASNTITQLTERLESLESQAKEWSRTGAKRLKEIEKILENKKYAVEAQKQLAKLDQELAKLGYDASAHDQARRAEFQLRSVEEEYANLKSAREVMRQIESEIENLEEERRKRQEEIEEQQKEFDAASLSLKEAETQSPNLDEAERERFKLREEENKTRSELGGAQQRVDILKTQRARRADYTNQREEIQKQIARHKTLERAFGKDGVPALLIEQALPQIESKANDLLDRLSDGKMSIRFVTQAEYKDKKREDLKETLDIQISDPAGVRDYEMYSGGEAFRVNFAIRLALSEVLAQRKGARLQSLVIDEGFGSQDVQGRQRLIEAINLVKNDFAKILVITHLDELKDAFPTRIEVEKTERGSVVRVI